MSTEEKELRNAWICESQKTLLDSSFMRIVERHCRSSEDPQKMHRFYLFESRDWCNIIPVTEDGKVVFVRQYRVGISSHTLEVPGGVMDDKDGDARGAAIREMTEETGYEPVEGFRCESLGWTYPNPAIQDNRCHLFIVGPVKKTREQNLDLGEMIDVLEIPIDEIPQRILNGEITHALMLNTFFFAALKSMGSSGHASKLSTEGLLETLRSFRDRTL